jgi:hypothetical protein
MTTGLSALHSGTVAYIPPPKPEHPLEKKIQHLFISILALQRGELSSEGVLHETQSLLEEERVSLQRGLTEVLNPQEMGEVIQRAEACLTPAPEAIEEVLRAALDAVRERTLIDLFLIPERSQVEVVEQLITAQAACKKLMPACHALRSLLYKLEHARDRRGVFTTAEVETQTEEEVEDPLPVIERMRRLNERVAMLPQMRESEQEPAALRLHKRRMDIENRSTNIWISGDRGTRLVATSRSTQTITAEDLLKETSLIIRESLPILVRSLTQLLNTTQGMLQLSTGTEGLSADEIYRIARQHEEAESECQEILPLLPEVGATIVAAVQAFLAANNDVDLTLLPSPAQDALMEQIRVFEAFVTQLPEN